MRKLYLILYFIVPFCIQYSFSQNELLTQKQNILNYLKFLPSLDSNRIISGQQCGHSQEVPTYYNNMIVGLHNKTGRWVGLMGADYGYISNPNYHIANSKVIEFSKKGGLVTISMHPSNPWNGKDVRNKEQVNLNELVTPGNAAYVAWHKELDKVSVALKELQDSNIVILFRPLHEANGDFFWYGITAHKNDHVPFINLWKDMYNYLSVTKELKNLIWVYSAFNFYNEVWTKHANLLYPGTEFVDVVGVDVYEDKLTIPDYPILKSFGKPIALTEFGPKTRDGSFDLTSLLKQIKFQYPQFVYWLSWHDWTGNNCSIVGNKNASLLLNDKWVSTLEDINWKTMDWSEVIWKTLKDTILPSAPANFNASEITTSSIKLQWNKSTDDREIVGYKIYKGSTFIDYVTDTTFLISNLSNGFEYTFKLKAVDGSGNESLFAETKIKTLTTSIKNTTIFKSLLVFPNPAKTNITVSYYSSSSQQVDIKIYDLLSKIHFEHTINTISGENSQVIDVSKLPQGFYLLKILSADYSETKLICIGKTK